MKRGFAGLIGPANEAQAGISAAASVDETARPEPNIASTCPTPSSFIRFAGITDGRIEVFKNEDHSLLFAEGGEK